VLTRHALLRSTSSNNATHSSATMRTELFPRRAPPVNWSRPCVGKGMPSVGGMAGSAMPVWTVGKVLACTRNKIERMEQREPELRRFLLVHKFMASVDTRVDPDAVAVDPAGCARAICPPTHGASAGEQSQSPTSPPPPAEASRPASPKRASHPLRRRRRLAVAGGNPMLVPSTVDPMSSRPFKKRRHNRSVLTDAVQCLANAERDAAADSRFC